MQCYESHAIKAGKVLARKMGALEHESLLPPAHLTCALQRKPLGCDRTERIMGSSCAPPLPGFVREGFKVLLVSWVDAACCLILV